ncbi:hypothetical protein EVAR_97168_1 [Eumeta japonica]|uniref:SWIM-type domain-containing protein n=1 Tax=Eumeta variegata TaxID=151549 RepID=A0A4C1XQK2_EUMVA|nr:hypothetical protein EVAR_71989_1 [Eumeta japonica]GBP66216.1 hypothetical protein EVAR_97168_1 [Eumeta japonica]
MSRTSSSSKAYSVTLTINEKSRKIQDVQCHDCAASAGGCKHALALVMWTHRRSEDPTPTEVACYWKNLDYQALAQL